MNFIKGRRADRRLLAVTYNKVVIVTENHLRFVTHRHITCKRSVNVEKFRIHVE